jgi:hypothetical protein
VLLFGIGTKALPSWDSKTRWNNLKCDLAVKLTTGPSGHDAVRERGMEPVLGDGLGTELGCWMEASVASLTIRNAGEFNGFLKSSTRLFVEPLHFADGNLMLPAGYTPEIDRTILAAHEIARERFVSSATAVST